MEFLRVRLQASTDSLAAQIGFYGDNLDLERSEARVFKIGATSLEFVPSDGQPFYHFALLVPGNRFEVALEWARERVALLPDSENGKLVFDFSNWNAFACYFHDPAGNIVELIAHREIDENEAGGAFAATELLGLSELGLVGDPKTMARELEQLGLHLWDGTLDEPDRLAFVGEKARTLILSPAGRGWLPTGRPAELHPVETTLSGERVGALTVGEVHRVGRRGSR
jgi:catechol 2,3-dioxygenase-like lactoylglutathione lyase family enzyme